MDINYLYKRLRATEALTADLLMLIGRSLPFLAEEASVVAAAWRDKVHELEHERESAPAPAAVATPAKEVPTERPTTLTAERLLKQNPAPGALDQKILQSMTQTGLDSLSALAASGNMRAGALVENLISDIKSTMGVTENVRSQITAPIDRKMLEEVIAVAIRDSYAFRSAQAKEMDQSILRKGPIEVIEDVPTDFVILGHGAVSVFLNLRENQFIFTPSTGSFYNRSTSNNWKSVTEHDKFDINTFILKAELDKLSALN